MADKKAEITLESLNRKLDGLFALIERHSVNYVRHVVKYHNARLDRGAKKIGEVGLAVLVALGLCGVVSAETIKVDSKSKGGAVYSLTRDTATSKMTMTVDNLVVSNSTTMAGVLTNSASVLNANGSSKTARMNITLPAVTETTTTNGYGDVNLTTLTASNRVADALSAKIKFNGNNSKTGTTTYVSQEFLTEDVTISTMDGGWRLRGMVGGLQKYWLVGNSNANAKVTLGLVTKFDKPFEVVTGSISNGALATASVDATKLAAGSVGGSEYIAGSISNVAIAASAAIAASKLGFDPVVSKTGADAVLWTAQIRLTAAGTNTYNFTSKGITSTNGLAFVGSYWSTVPTVATNHIAFTSVTTNTVLIKGEPGEDVKIIGAQ